MIPFLTSTWLRGGLAVGLVLLVAFMGWRVSAWRSAYQQLPELRGQLEVERSCAEGSACARRAAELTEKAATASREAVAIYEQELARVRSERPVRVVRLCPNTGNVSRPRTTPGTDAGTTAPGELSGPTGRDIGPDLYALAREADEIVATCRALQNWNRALSVQ